jgi:hypothetical protein
MSLSQRASRVPRAGSLGTPFRVQTVLQALLPVAVGLAAASAWAAGPLVAAGADVAPPGDCQVELGVYTQHERVASSTAQRSAIGECGIGLRSQLTLTYSTSRQDDSDRRSVSLGGLTSLWRAQGEGPQAGVSIAWAVTRAQPENGTWAHDSASWAAVATVPMAPLLLHANLGRLREAEDGTRSATWNLAAEWVDALPHTDFTLEGYGDDRSGGWMQAGARWYVVPEKFSVFASLARQAGSGTSLLGVGLRFSVF